MNREIKFRGKRLDNGDWVYGYYCKHIKRQVCPMGDELKFEDVDHLIIHDGFADWNMPIPLQVNKVDPETVGQYTGRLDDSGTKIYHGDILDWTFSGFSGNFYVEPRVGVVKWSDRFLSFVISDNTEDDFFESDLIYFGDAFEASGETKIIGTMYDNPELLEV